MQTSKSNKSIFNPELIITEDRWAISIAMHNHGLKMLDGSSDVNVVSEHAFLIIQSPDNLYRKEFGPRNPPFNERIQRCIAILKQLNASKAYGSGRIEEALQGIGCKWRC